ncbi:hypothetical protein BDP81DRAFT_85588 [Colletotrichum phormii]|uniref:Uncharacterized protein n=1 Tax=Colletotrichum phormii TaxID=359342 RepID=A0AAJ0A1X8_9PEZI|nr:uncharacterized protein BDP81DRAFT_85588 [Colletotrichum phormii]KAK1654584.1 hypothetical protein BDP81DRAFT_85588 [Colletotrichum phormii]
MSGSRHSCTSGRMCICLVLLTSRISTQDGAAVQRPPLPLRMGFLIMSIALNGCDVVVFFGSSKLHGTASLSRVLPNCHWPSDSKDHGPCANVVQPTRHYARRDEALGHPPFYSVAAYGVRACENRQLVRNDKTLTTTDQCNRMPYRFCRLFRQVQ